MIFRKPVPLEAHRLTEAERNEILSTVRNSMGTFVGRLTDQFVYEHDTWAFVFITTSVAWEKVRIYQYQKCIIETHIDSQLKVLEVCDIQANRLRQIAQCEKDVPAFKAKFMKAIDNYDFSDFKLTNQLEPVKSLNTLLYEERFMFYSAYKTRFLAALNVPGQEVVTNQLLNIKNNRLYELTVKLPVLKQDCFIRLFSAADYFYVETLNSAELKAQTTVNIAFQKIKLSFLEAESFAKSISSTISRLHELGEMLEHLGFKMQQSPQNQNSTEPSIISVQWNQNNSLGSSIELKIPSKSMLGPYDFQLNHVFYGQDLEKTLALNMIDVAEKINNLQDLYTRINLYRLKILQGIEGSSIGDISLLITSVAESKLNCVFQQIRNSKLNDQVMDVFVFSIVSFPLPLRFTISYDFGNHEFVATSYYGRRRFTSRQNMYGQIFQNLNRIASQWSSIDPLPQIDVSTSVFLPANADKLKKDWVPKMQPFDYVSIVEKNELRRCLYLGDSKFLVLELDPQYPTLKRQSSLVEKSTLEFLAGKNFVLRRQPFTQEQVVAIRHRLSNVGKNFIYMGVLNNQETVINKILYNQDPEKQPSPSLLFMLMLVTNLAQAKSQLFGALRGLLAGACQCNEKKKIHLVGLNEGDILKQFVQIYQQSRETRSLLSRLEWIFEERN